MRRGLALALLALIFSPTATADVLQVGIDPSRTGFAQDAGPKLDEVAWSIRLPGSTTTGAWPIIIGDQAYIATSDMRHHPELDRNAIWAISLADGSATPVIELDPTGTFSGTGGDVDGQGAGVPRTSFGHGVVSDGERFYVTGAERVAVYDIATGVELWAWHYPELYIEHDIVWCASAAVTQRSLIVGCTAFGRAPGDLGDGETQTIENAVFVATLDLATHDLVWLWVRDPASEVLAEDVPDNPACTTEAAGGPCALVLRTPIVAGLSTFGGMVVASVYSTIEPATGTEYKSVVGLDASTGELRWIKQAPRDAASGEDPALEEGIIHMSWYATGDGADGFVAFRDLLRINPSTGAVIEAFDLAPRGESVAEVGSALALTDDRLFFTSPRALYAVDRHDLTTELWAESLPLQSSGSWSMYPLTYADGVVYGHVLDGFGEVNATDPVASSVPDNTSHFRAHDAETGELLWTRTVTSDFRPRFFAVHVSTVGAGVMLVAGQDGNVVAIGRTDASLRPAVVTSTFYPAVGHEVAIDAGDTPASTWAGAPGPTAPSAFRVDWGDGTITDWQPEPAFSHVYATSGDREAVLYVRNEAGQQSAEAVTLHVGGTPPPELNFVQRAFQRENYDLTFGVLGVAVAVSGGLIALAARKRRHGRLQRELEGIDAAAEAAAGVDVRLRAAMEERRARCHGLLIDHTIDEAQYAVLERHIEAQLRKQRLDRLRELFDFLPTAMTRALEHMLEDGQITAVERHGVQAMVDANDVLTKAQKRKITALVDEWFGQDHIGR